MNIYEYIDKYKNYSFKEKDFNEVDNLVLSLLSYVEYDNIIDNRKHFFHINISEISKAFFNLYDNNYINNHYYLVKDSINLLKVCGNTKRYGNIYAIHYINDLDYKNEKQFSAITFLLDNNIKYIAYRGTDNTLLGWKEDFNMAFIHPIPSQRDALMYLNRNSMFGKNIIIGGHSKGGNEAVYAGVKCNKRLRNKIINIYSNDGPGFNETFINSDDYKLCSNKIIKFVPENSIVGMLFNTESYKVIASSNKGIMQHDGFSWLIDDDHFEYIDNINKKAINMDKRISNFIESLSLKEKEKFVDTLFLIFDVNNIKNVNDLLKINPIIIFNYIKSLTKLKKDEKDILIKVIKNLITIKRK